MGLPALPFELAMENLLNPEDLEANRAGKITDAQRQRIGSPVSGMIGLGSMLLSVWFIPGLCFVLTIALIILRVSFLLILLFFTIMSGITVWIVAKSVITFLNQRSRIQKDLAAGVIKHAEGCLTFGKDGYQLDIGGQKLVVPRNLGGLLPGIIYSVYYLPETGLVLSAEKISIMDETEAKDRMLKILSMANRFSLQALAANRQGRMTGEQAPRFIGNILLGLIFMIFPALLIASAIYQSYIRHAAMNMSMTGVLVTIAFGLLFAAVSLWIIIPPIRDLLGGKAVCIEGIGGKTISASRSQSRSGRSSGKTTYTYYYLIDDQRFSVPKRAYPALIDGITYRLYYGLKSKTLLSIEPLESPARAEAINL
jgi:hypothetical protein